jgi:hypothetical protein
MQTQERPTRHGQPQGPREARTPTSANSVVRMRAQFSAAGLALALVVTLTLLAPTSAFAITRDAVFARAQSWVDKPVAYSQARHHLGYRTDCSGYVSMCWATGTSWSTSTFHAVTRRITTTQLKPGDAMLKKGYHIRLFEGWTDDTHTQYVAYEANTLVAVVRVHSLAEDLHAGYVPVRYNRITDGAQPANVLRNRSFDVWSRSWGPGGEQPIWWQVDGAQWETLAVHRTNVHRTGLSSLQLLNSGDDAETPTELSQTASVTAGTLYRLSAWAMSATDPSGVGLRVAYLDAGGGSLSETGTTGDQWGIGGSAFRQMSVLSTAPAGAVAARVSVTLAAETSAGVRGTSVILDDVSLARPQVSVSIRPSSATSRVGRTLTLSGSVTPSFAAGKSATVYLQRPGASWKRLKGVTIASSSTGTATWSASYRFARGLRKGTYRYRIVVPGVGGYLGTTSNTVSVRLK